MPYAPMQVYIILTIGVACHAVITSIVISKSSSTTEVEIPPTINALLLLAWMSLVISTVNEMSSWSPPNQNATEGARPGSLWLFTQMLHLKTIILFPCWIPSFLFKVDDLLHGRPLSK